MRSRRCGEAEHLDADASFDALLDRIEPKSRDALHRYVFRISDRGNPKLETTFEYEQAVGAFFFGQLRIAVGMGPAERWTAMPESAPSVQFLKEGARVNGRMILPVGIASPRGGNRETIPMLIATGFGGSMVLPPGLTFPRWEIPGIAEVGGTVARKFRRQLLRATVPELGFDSVVEALGDEQTEYPRIPPVTVGGVVWRRYSEEQHLESTSSGKPLVLLFSSDLALLPRDVLDAPDVREALAGFVPAIGRWIRGDPVLAGRFVRYENGPSPGGETADALIVLYPWRPDPSIRRGWFAKNRALALTAGTSAAEVAEFLRASLRRAESR